jgi:hypothetical protein
MVSCELIFCVCPQKLVTKAAALGKLVELRRISNRADGRQPAPRLKMVQTAPSPSTHRCPRLFVPLEMVLERE